MEADKERERVALQVFEVGKKFPIKNPTPFFENVRTLIVKASFDVVYFIKNYSKDDIKIWTSNPLNVGVYIDENKVPFIIFDFVRSGWNFDCTINILAENEETKFHFINTKGNMVTMFLVDAIDNTLLAMRGIGMQYATMDAIKNACKEQLSMYRNKEEVDKKIDAIINRFTTSELMKRCKYVDMFR